MSIQWGKLRYFGWFFLQNGNPWSFHKDIDKIRFLQIVEQLLKCSFLWPPTNSTISHCALVKPFWQQKFFNLTSTNGQVCVVDGPGGNLQSLSLLSVPFRFEIDPDFLKQQEKYCKTKSLEILETLQKPLFQNDWKCPDTTDLIVLLLGSTSTWGTFRGYTYVSISRGYIYILGIIMLAVGREGWLVFWPPTIRWKLFKCPDMPKIMSCQNYGRTLQTCDTRSWHMWLLTCAFYRVIHVYVWLLP